MSLLLWMVELWFRLHHALELEWFLNQHICSYCYQPFTASSSRGLTADHVELNSQTNQGCLNCSRRQHIFIWPYKSMPSLVALKIKYMHLLCVEQLFHLSHLMEHYLTSSSCSLLSVTQRCFIHLWLGLILIWFRLREMKQTESNLSKKKKKKKKKSWFVFLIDAYTCLIHPCPPAYKICLQLWLSLCWRSGQTGAKRRLEQNFMLCVCVCACTLTTQFRPAQ